MLFVNLLIPLCENINVIILWYHRRNAHSLNDGVNLMSSFGSLTFFVVIHDSMLDLQGY